MLTPAAKRRRAEAATATLSRPFRSPSVRRGGIGGANSSKPIPKPEVEAKMDADTKKATAAHTFSSHQTLTTAASPERRHKPPRSSSRLKGAHQPVKGTQTHFLGSLVDQFCLDLDAGDRIIADARAAARKDDQLTSVSTTKGGHGDENQELHTLIARWKEAGRLAAEDVFSLVSERVERLGGVRAWQAMGSQQPENESSGSRRGRRQKRQETEDDDGEACRRQSDSEHENEDEEDCEAEAEKEDTQVSAVNVINAQRETHRLTKEFTMPLMLASLNVDQSLLGYDEVEERWKD